MSEPAMDAWDVYARRSEGADVVRVGAVSAPDAAMAALLAREAFFRHGEAVEGWIGRGDQRIAVACSESLGGMLDRTYRRAEGYPGVGAKLLRVREELVARGLAPREAASR